MPLSLDNFVFVPFQRGEISTDDVGTLSVTTFNRKPVERILNPPDCDGVA